MSALLRMIGCLTMMVGCLTSVIAQQNETQGHKQLEGINAVFGETYTLRNSLNLTIYSIKCQLEPYVCYENNGVVFPRENEKLVVIQFGLKNSTEQDVDFGDGSGFFTLVSSAGEKFQATGLSLGSMGSKEMFVSLKPGQGLGQPETKDLLRMVAVVPGNARIDKIIVNQGRKGHDNEEVMRYLLFKSDPAGEKKNVIVPLPESVVDRSDPSGSTALELGTTLVGSTVPSGGYSFQVDSLTKDETRKWAGEAIDESKALWIATVKVCGLGEKQALFDALSDDVFLSDSDGERYSKLGTFKLKSDEAVDSSRAMPKGEPYSVRLPFLLPKDAKPQSLTIMASGGRKWKVEFKA